MVKIADSVIDEIRTSVNIVELVGQYVELRQKGRDFWGCCPFHSEKTPSFKVNEERGLFHCFGCSASGNSISFIMRYHNFDFADAVRFLAEKYGIRIDTSEAADEARDIVNLHEELTLLGKRWLFSADGSAALEYLRKRLITDEDIDTFGFGFFPARPDMKQVMNRYSKKVLNASGLFVEGQYGLRSRFYNRLMIPIRNISGRVHAFSGRSLDGSNPKYINSPETDLFKKRETLYNIDKARQPMKEISSCIVVEGYFDVIRLVKAGFHHTVAPMGTALTAQQLTLLRRYADEVILLFDGDEAGKKAAFRTLDAGLETGFFPYVAFLPEGEDPDTFVSKYGANGLNRLLATKKDLMILAIERMSAGTKDINDKVSRLGRVKEKLVKISDAYRRDHYLKETARIFQVGEEHLVQDVNLSRAKSVISSRPEKAVKKPGMNIIPVCEIDFLAGISRLDADMLDKVLHDLSPDYFTEGETCTIFKKVLAVFGAGANIDTLVNDPEVGSTYAEFMLRELPGIDLYMNVMQNREQIMLNYVQKRIATLSSEVAVHLNDKAKMQSISEEIQQLMQQRKEIMLRTGRRQEDNV